MTLRKKRKKKLLTHDWKIVKYHLILRNRKKKQEISLLIRAKKQKNKRNLLFNHFLIG